MNQYYTLGNSGLRVSRLALGTMTFGTDWGWGADREKVAVNWAANRPGIASVLVGATKPHQLEDNLKALEFSIPEELCVRLNPASTPELSFHYTFFTPGMQVMLTSGVVVRDKPNGYYPTVKFDAKPVGVE